MSYFNRKCQPLKMNRKDLQYLSSGECASVYHNNEIILKEYFSETPIFNRLDPETFDILKSIDHENFMKLLEIYCDLNYSELIEYKINIRNFSVDASIAKYYHDDSVNVLYESIDYILDNFRNLDKLFEIFTDNSILTDDVKRKNAILSQKGIIIIDPDTFRCAPLPKEDIAVLNKKELLTLLRSICISSIGKIKNHDELIKKIVLDLTAIDISDKTDMAHEIAKKLKYVKKPIEYLVKK